MNQFYDRKPRLCQGQIQFVDTITRQTYRNANGQKNSDRLSNLLHLDMEQEDWWYSRTSGIVHQDENAIFGLKKVTPVTGKSLTRSQDAGMYNRNDIRGFWDNIPVNAAPGSGLEKFFPDSHFSVCFAGMI